MKKNFFVPLLLSVLCSLTHASDIHLYGVVDIGYLHDSNSHDVSMDERAENRLGIKGSEDLGNGLKAIFQLEQRFNLTNGQESINGDFEGAANVGLSGRLGKLRFGRLNELSTETIRKLDPFNQDGVGSMFLSNLRGDDGSGRLSNTIRWDSPVMHGVQLGASYTIADSDNSISSLSHLIASNSQVFNYASLGISSTEVNNDGYALSLIYTNDQLYAIGNYTLSPNSSESDTWNLGAAYNFGEATISAAYQETDINHAMLQESWLFGATYALGKSELLFSYNDQDVSLNGAPLSERRQYALGYRYHLSNRSTLYADLVYEELDSDILPTNDANTINIGLTHTF